VPLKLLKYTRTELICVDWNVLWSVTVMVFKQK